MRLGSVPRRPGWPLVPLPPSVVIAVGIAVAVATGVVGIDHLGRASDEQASAQAVLVASTLAARLDAIPPSSHSDVLRHAQKRGGFELALVSEEGTVLADAMLRVPDRATLVSMVRHGSGEATTWVGRTRFAVHALPGRSERVIAMVVAPTSPRGAPAFVTALLALTTLLVGVAAAVAYAVARDASTDVEYVLRRVAAMAHVRTEPMGETIPVRTLDEVGQLTSAFNELVGRFSAAEEAYRADLNRAGAADKDRAAFLAAVSHELRSPLNAILGFADILLTEVDGPLTEEAKQEVEQIRESGQHLLELINDILEFSALETGQLRLSRSKVDLLQVATEVVREAEGVLTGKNLDVLVSGEPNVIAHVDARRVRQILTNLVGNAIKFTQRGNVVVHVSRAHGNALVSVSDTGPGISAAERAHIFEDYKQTKEERPRRRGTGLGLAIARRLVLMHGGTIRVESELGQGSTFNVELPLWREFSPKQGRPA